MLARERLAQPAEVGEPVLVVEEAGRPIVPALEDMQRRAVDVDTCAPGQMSRIAEIEPGPFSPLSNSVQ